MTEHPAAPTTHEHRLTTAACCIEARAASQERPFTPADDDPLPTHPWAGSDDGHNCATCIEQNDHFNKCDRLAHLTDPMAILTDQQRRDLNAALERDHRSRRVGEASARDIPLATDTREEPTDGA